MIITKLQGGLGNQIFQWGYGKSLSITHGIDLFLDTTHYNNQLSNTPRKYELIKFPNLKHNKPNYGNKRIIQISDNFNYEKLHYDDNYSYYLNGFWQSEKYFLNISDIIRDELQPDDETLEKLKSKVEDNSVSLHIRRTDYVTSNGFHPVQTIEYYNKALETIGDYNQLLVFSDDISWCKNNLKYDNIFFVENQDSIEDLWLMSLCAHNIIANSSFSWWGAWLNKNKNKKVIAPMNWFGGSSELNQSDIVPDTWIKI
jgi:hypothetical protein